ncbi:hypothetical protein PVK06_018873 [Gossypium arboreum]|uniref:Uncharacterized protein n=1 Tax=Gossypium arboreum TaxID=29729 RepID=A0ABR0PIG0_GOSAR|nr:hypothetical protein PVK06_018873 [Gossypium arboreum]
MLVSATISEFYDEICDITNEASSLDEENLKVKIVGKTLHSLASIEHVNDEAKYVTTMHIFEMNPEEAQKIDVKHNRSISFNVKADVGTFNGIIASLKSCKNNC